MESKYSYAFDRNSNLVNINDLDRKITKFGEIFFCLGCNNPLIPRLGKIKIKHYAHKHIEISCNYESYLHKLSKTIFFNEYTKCLNNNLPFNITILKKSSCNFYQEKYNLICSKNEPFLYYYL